MPARTRANRPHPRTIADVKAYFGFQPGTRYTTIAQKKNARLARYLPVDPTPDRIRTLIEDLSKAPRSEWERWARHTAKLREIERRKKERDDAEARRQALSARRAATVAKRDGTAPAREPVTPAPRPAPRPRTEKQKEAFARLLAKRRGRARAPRAPRAPRKPRYTMTAEVGATYEYRTNDGLKGYYTVEMTLTLSHTVIESNLSPDYTEFNTLPIVREAIRNIVPYTARDYGSRGRMGGTSTGYRFVGPMDDIMMRYVPSNTHSSQSMINYWMTEQPTINVEEPVPNTTLINEPMRRASVLRQNFVKHAGGIDQTAYESKGQCVIRQLLSVLLQPRYTLPITKISPTPGSDDLVPLDWYSLRRYFGVLDEELLQQIESTECEDVIAAYEEAEQTPGITPTQLAMLCNDMRLNMYGLDYKSRTFTRITAYSDVSPRGQSSAGFTRNECADHHPLVYYSMNEHMYLITHKQVIKSIVESCKENDTHGTSRADNTIDPDDLPYVTNHNMTADEIFASGASGRYIMPTDDLTEELRAYMRATNDNPRIKTRDGRTTAITTTTVTPPPAVRPRPIKPLRKNYPRNDSGHDEYIKDIYASLEEMEAYRLEREAFKKATVAKRTINVVLEANPNHTDDLHADITRAFCDHAGVVFENQGLGRLALQLAHPSRDNIPMKVRKAIIESQNDVCCKCERVIALSACADDTRCCELDHKIPLHAGGTNVRSNLQYLCKACHSEKTSAESHGGFRKTREYHSTFAPCIIDQILPQTKTWAFSELLERGEDGGEIIRTPDQCYAADMNAAYPNTLLHHPTPWPKYCSLDTPCKYDGGDIVQGAMYKVDTTATMPFHGAGYYDSALVHFGLQQNIISKSDIKEAWIPRNPLPAGFVKPYHDAIMSHFADLDELPHEEKPKRLAKRLLCSFIGTMEQIDTETEWTAATMSPATAADMAMSNGGDDVMLTKPFTPLVRPRYTVTELHQIIAVESPGDLENPLLFADVLRRHAKRLNNTPWVDKCVDLLLKQHTFTEDDIHTDVSDIVPENAVKCITKAYNTAVAELNAAITPRDRELIVKRIDDMIEQDRATTKAGELDQIYVAHHHREVKCITSACLIRRCTIQRANLEMFKLCQQVRAIDGVLRWIKTDYVAWWLPPDNEAKTIDLTALKWEDTDIQMFKEEPLLSLHFESQPRYIREASPPFQPPAITINARYDGSDARAFVLKNVYEPHRCALLTGPPGTGKTFATNAFIDILEENGDVFIACSTSHVSKNIMGNETSRLRDENCDEAANTIHSEYMRYNRDPQLYIGKLLKRGVEWLIIDEVGMMPTEFYDFLCHLRRAIPALCIVLVGDYTQLTPVKDPWFISREKTNILKSAAVADIIDGNAIVFSLYMRGDRDDPQGGKAVFDTFMQFNRFIKGAVLIPKDNVMNIVKAAKSARDLDSALQLIDAPIETLKVQLRGKRVKELQDTVSRLIDEYNTRETALCDGVDALTHDEISQDVPAMFPITEETDINIAYTHATRKIINQHYMDKYAALQDDVLSIPAPTDTEEQQQKLQDVKLFAGAPLIAIKTFQKQKIYNAEMFVVDSFYRPPMGWHNLNLIQIKEVARLIGASTTGKKKEVVENIEYVGVSLRVRNLRSGVINHMPLHFFHRTFRIAYCITVHQSQGQTIRDRYTIYDWNLNFLSYEERARAKYVALSRGTRKDHVQIDTSDSDLYNDKVLSSFIKNVVLNDAFVGEKPDFDEFAVRCMLDANFAEAAEVRFEHGEIEALHGTCKHGMYPQIAKSFIKCFAEANPYERIGVRIIDDRIVMPKMTPVIFQHRYESTMARIKAQRDAANSMVTSENAADIAATELVKAVIDSVAPVRRLDVPIPSLDCARRALQINGIDSVLQLRVYLDRRITHAVEGRTVTSMREIRETAHVEFGGVRQFTRRFKKAKWLKLVTKRIKKAYRPTYAYQARDYADECIEKGLEAYVSTAMAPSVNLHPRGKLGA